MPSKRRIDADLHPAPAEPSELAPVIRLRPMRILVISPDRAYRDRAMTVLADVGSVSFAMTSLTERDVAALVAEERPDVVLLDATGCESVARKAIATLAETAPQAGIVVVCHHCTEAARELSALPKWGWTQDLRAGVELAYREGNPLRPGSLSSLRRRSPWQRMAGPLRRH